MFSVVQKITFCENKSEMSGFPSRKQIVGDFLVSFNILTVFDINTETNFQSVTLELSPLQTRLQRKQKLK